MATNVAEPATVPERRLKMTYEEFLAWYGEGQRGEWVDGEVVVFMPPSELHQDLVGFLFALLTWYARRFELGKVMLSPFEMLIGDGRRSRQPDLLFVAHRHAERRTGLRIEGPADLVVEVVSDDSVTRDRREKFAEYQEAGIPEYWLLDPRPRQRRAEFFHRGADGAYQPIQADDQGRYHSVVLPGFWLDPNWLWQDPLPDPDELKPLILAEDGRDTAPLGDQAGRAESKESTRRD